MIKNDLLKSCITAGIAVLFIATVIVPMGVGDNQNLSLLMGSLKNENTTQSFSNSGLMNSSWPMFHQNAQHTGLSPYGIDGNWYEVQWTYLMDGLVDSSPAIDKNGSIHIGGSSGNYFFTINSNGTENWRFKSNGYFESSPALAKDGIIYVGSDDGGLYAIYPNGTKKWRVGLGGGWVFSSPVVDNEGIVYAAATDGQRICAINPNGTIKWSFIINDFIYCSPALDQEGNIYIGSNDGYMYSIYSNGTLKWKFYAGGEKGIGSAPSIAEDGTIYFGGTSGYLYALNPNGTLKWSYSTGYIGGSSPAVGTDGTIYVGSNNGRVYAIKPDGTEKWHYQTGKDISASPAIDKNGIIYIGCWDGNLYAINPDGTLRWKFAAGDSIESSVAIGADGTIYVAAEFLPPPDFLSRLYAIKVINDQPPTIPTINGPDSGKKGQNYDYTIISTDPDENNISYFVDWGDGTNTGWIGPYFSGQEIIVNHTWNKRGTYTIQVKAKDIYEAESNWGTLKVKMPINNIVIDSPLLQFLERFLEKHPNAFPILRHLLDQ